MLRYLPQVTDPKALVGTGSKDDAAVYRLTDDLAIVATVDYITPVVDDPYAFGQIAAANSLSDVFAMGAQPAFALNVVNFPRENLPLDKLGEIVRGGADKAAEAGVAILGGHSVDDPEIKYGLVAIGVVHPEHIVRNVGGRPGDRLVLTKGIGTGVITTAVKADAAGEEEIATAVASMAALNLSAARAMLRVGVNAATDITGFGLLGHLSEMLAEGAVDAVIQASAVPTLPGTRGLAERGFVPGGSRRNRDALADVVVWDQTLAEIDQLILCDAQTSGGMLIAVAVDRLDQLLGELECEGVSVRAVVGELRQGAGRIHVSP